MSADESCKPFAVDKSDTFAVAATDDDDDEDESDDVARLDIATSG